MCLEVKNVKNANVMCVLKTSVHQLDEMSANKIVCLRLCFGTIFLLSVFHKTKIKLKFVTRHWHKIQFSVSSVYWNLELEVKKSEGFRK